MNLLFTFGNPVKISRKNVDRVKNTRQFRGKRQAALKTRRRKNPDPSLERERLARLIEEQGSLAASEISKMGNPPGRVSMSKYRRRKNPSRKQGHSVKRRKNPRHLRRRRNPMERAHSFMVPSHLSHLSHSRKHPIHRVKRRRNPEGVAAMDGMVSKWTGESMSELLIIALAGGVTELLIAPTQKYVPVIGPMIGAVPGAEAILPAAVGIGLHMFVKNKQAKAFGTGLVVAAVINVMQDLIQKFMPSQASQPASASAPTAGYVAGQEPGFSGYVAGQEPGFSGYIASAQPGFSGMGCDGAGPQASASGASASAPAAQSCPC